MTITDDFKSMTTATDIAASKGEKTHSQDPTNFCTSSLILSQQKLQATHQFMTSTLFFSFQNLKISRELHINQMKVDHSSWNWQWQVARMKAKMDCAFMTLQARLGCAWPFWWVKRWKVRLFPTINSNSDSWLTTPFSFHTAKAVWERVFCCFYCYVRTSTNEVANNSTGMCMILSAPLFCRLECKSTSKSCFQSQLSWWPHPMNVLKNGPCHSWGQGNSNMSDLHLYALSGIVIIWLSK